MLLLNMAFFGDFNKDYGLYAVSCEHVFWCPISYPLVIPRTSPHVLKLNIYTDTYSWNHGTVDVFTKQTLWWFKSI